MTRFADRPDTAILKHMSSHLISSSQILVILRKSLHVDEIGWIFAEIVYVTIGDITKYRGIPVSRSLDGILSSNIS